MTQSIVLTELAPNVLRLLGFLVLAAVGAGGTWIAHILWVSLALPWLWDLRRLFARDIGGFATVSGWDLRYAGWSAVNPLLGQQLQGIDMVIVGALFSSTVAAEYSIASRLATLFPFFQQIAARGFAPRAGDLIARKEIGELNRELSVLRSWSLVLVALMSTAIIAPGVLYLPLFGDYVDALPIMIALAAAPVVRSVFVGIDIALRMTGRAGYGALISACSATVVVVFAWLLHGAIGIHALPASMLISAATINIVAARLIERTGVVVWDLRALLGVCIALAGVGVAQALGDLLLSSTVCCLSLLAAAGFTFLRNRHVAA